MTQTTVSVESPSVPKIDPAAPQTRRYPELINTDAVLSYLKELHGQVDTIAFNLRSTLNNIVSGNVQTNETPVENKNND